MRISAFIWLLFFLLAFQETWGQGTVCHHTTEGTEFWFGYMQGRDLGSGHSVEITITAKKSTSFSIYLGKSTTAYGTYTVSSNSSNQITLPLALVEATGSETVQDKAIRLVAQDSVNVYALNWAANSSDVAVIYPATSLGKEYFAMCYTPHVHSDINHGRNSEFLIVASQNDTRINITPKAEPDGPNVIKTPFTIILNMGEVYQVQSLNGDLTGSFISSDKPIAVYSGSLSTTIPFSAPGGGWDHLFEQMPPVNAWGREYYAVPLVSRSKDYFRVMASQDSTTIYIGTNIINLNKGDNYEFTLNSPTKIFATKQILVAQFSQSKSNDQVTDGDGFMVILSPVSQAKNDVTFVAYTSSRIKKYFVNIVVPTTESGNIEFDETPLGGFTPFADDLRYSYLQYAITQGTHRLRNIDPNSGFIAYVYGFGGNEAYGYGVGFSLNLRLDISEGLETWPNLSSKGDTLGICQGESVKLDADPYFDFYRWNTGDSVRAISVSGQGKYSVRAWTIDGCEKNDSIFIRVSDPHTNIGKDLAGCPPYSATLDGGAGFQGYLWNTGAKTRNISVNTTGQYSVKAFDKLGCPAKDTMNFTVYPVPGLEITGETLICGDKSGSLKMNFSGTDENTWKQGSFQWNSDHPGKLTFNNPALISAGYSVADFGKYKIGYTLKTVNNCVTKDSLEVGLFRNPTSETGTQDPGKCGEYNRIVEYRGNASPAAHLHWDYGGLALLKEIDWKTKLVSLGAVSSNPFISLYVEENGCLSDTSRLAVGANPSFTMNTAKSRGCDSVTVYFSGKLNVPDNQLQFLWNFGDHSDDSISTAQLPDHFYAKTGNYDVSLLITNKITGCQVGFKVDDMVKIFTTPVAIISTDPATCYGDTIPVIFTLNRDSSICYWQFDGARQTGAGNDSIRIVIDKPIAKIGLRVNEYGCFSKPVETAVKRKPNFDFAAVPVQGCQPLNVDFTPLSSDPYLSFSWKADTMKSILSEPSFLFSKAGLFPVRLTALSSETGCSDSIGKNSYIRVHPKPLAAFGVDYPVAILGQSNLSFTNKTALADKYLWDFSDGGTSTEKNPRHNFKSLGKFPVTLFVESQFGCSDTTGMEIEILPFDIATPNAFRPDSYIRENRVFMPFSKGVDTELFRIRIYNRWGQLVFESKSLENPWDGTMKNGVEAPMGNYVWRAEYTDIQGFQHERTGQVLLIR